MAVLCCVEAFAYSEPNGVQRVLRPGDLVDDNDPAVKGRADKFETVEANAHRATERAAGKPVDGVIEQATKAPGEKRAVQVPDAPPKSGPGSGRDAWAAYAASLGVEVTDDMNRDDIVEALG